MCGINGFNFENKDLIHKMNESLQYRGPDGEGVFVGHGVSLGHRRLSIIDTHTRSSQPMWNKDHTHLIVFNGEIYNFKELKQQYFSSYDFETESDTEVILAAFDKWGVDCLSYLSGMFAFAIYDCVKKTFFVARDKQGIKPLYYSFKDGVFIFSSEIKSILEHSVSRVLNKDAFYYYFSLLYVPEPLTMIEGIFKLPQASYLLCSKDGIEITSYWKRDFDTTRYEPLERIYETFTAGVKSELISDRPLGIYLSGGLDSSAILHSVARERKNIDTFSIGFTLSEDEENKKFNNDLLLASQTAQKYKTNHHEFFVTPKEVLTYFDEMIYAMDEPISNPTALSLFILSQKTKKYVDVVLSGDGGDELFGGYERYRLLKWLDMFYRNTPFFFKKILFFVFKKEWLLYSSEAAFIRLFVSQKENTLKKIINKKYLKQKNIDDFFEKKVAALPKDLSLVKKAMEIDRTTWLVDFDLMLADKMSMRHGLEVRVPFLHDSLINTTCVLSVKDVVGFWQTKPGFRSLLRHKIPDFLLIQPKRGFFSPGAKWLRQSDFALKVEHMLSPHFYLETRDLFCWDHISVMFDNHKKGGYALQSLWAIAVFQSWAKQYRIEV